MKKNNKNKMTYKAPLLLLLFAFSPNVNAMSGTYNVDSKTIKIGETTSINLNVSNVNDVMALAGTISLDETCLKINNISSTNPMVSTFDKNFVYQSFGDISAGNILSLSVTGLKQCSTKVNVLSPMLTSSSGVEIKADVVPGTVIVKEDEKSIDSTPVSQQIVVTGPSKSEESSTNSNPSTAPPQEEKKVTNSASTNNSTSASKTTSESSQKQSSASNVVAQTPGTNNKVNNSQIALNNDLSLSSLTIEGYEISFNKDVLEYSIDVLNEVEKINVNAIASDSKANVSVENNENLFVGENIVKVIVSNNNDKKIYTIKVNRKQDPNKVYNTDNYLTNIVPSIGMLSPSFDKEISNYIVYVPYEVESITFENTLSAPDTSNIEFDGPEKLAIGENNYTIKVRAESGDIRKYNILVKRFNKYDVSISNNYLKSLSLDNNSLLNSKGKKIDFNKDITTYYYKKGDGISYNYVVDDPSAIVKIVEDGDTINIIVEALNGEIRVYSLIPYENDSLIYIYLFILGLVLGYIIKFLIVIFKRRKISKKGISVS